MRIAVLGCGSIGHRHLRNLRSVDNAELVAYDPSTKVQNIIEQEFGVSVYHSLDHVWDQRPDVVLVNSPPNHHLDLGLAAAKNGCHLFIEKPLAHTLVGLDDLIKEVRNRQLINMVACNMRFHPGPAMIKKLLDENAIGDVISARLQFSSYLPNWRPWQDYRKSYTASSEWGGAILDCIHEIDLALWYFGAGKVAAAVHLPANAIGLDTDGLAEIILRHESGVLSNVHVNFVQRDYNRNCQIVGSEGTIYWDFNNRNVLVYGSDGKVKDTYNEPENWQLNDMYIDELQHFLYHVQHGGEPNNPIQEGLSTLKIALSARDMNCRLS